MNEADNYQLEVHQDDEDVLNTSLKFAFVNLESCATPESEKSIGFNSSLLREPAPVLDKSIGLDQEKQTPADDHTINGSNLTPASIANSEIQTKRNGTPEALVSRDLIANPF